LAHKNERQCAREGSMVAVKMVSVRRQCIEGANHKGVRILEKCLGWQPRNGFCVHAKYRRLHQINCVSVLEWCPGWQPKMASVCRRSVEGGTQKTESVRSGIVQCCSQKLRQFAGEVWRFATKKGIQCPREVSRVATKKLRPCEGEISKVAKIGLQ
jgi:hypothetical protein